MLSKLGDIQSPYIVGDYARGIDSGIIDLVLAGEIDMTYLQNLVSKLVPVIRRKIRILALDDKELKVLKGMLKLDEAIMV